MQKITATSYPGRQNDAIRRVKRFARRLERLPADDLFEKLTAVMYRLILFFGIPYLFYVLWSFLHTG